MPIMHQETFQEKCEKVNKKIIEILQDIPECIEVNKNLSLKIDLTPKRNTPLNK